MAKTKELLEHKQFGETERTDNWWAKPTATFIGLSIFIVYATYRTFYPVLFPGATLGITHEALLSPFYSPLLFSVEPNHHAWIGAFPSWWPRLLRSPAMLILWAPAGFRLTCYYYRKAYYRSFFQDPTACSVNEGRHEYHGETRFLLFQNLHRYFLYLALVFILILSFDAFRACFWNVPEHAGFFSFLSEGDFKVTIGTLVLATNAFLLAGYTFGCHSLRYLVGGKLRCFTCPKSEGETSSRYHLWKFVSNLNVDHPVWAWLSLYMVAFTDFYVWMVATGTWNDLTIIS